MAKNEKMVRTVPTEEQIKEIEAAVSRSTGSDDPWASVIQGLSMFTDDFLADGAKDLPLQER